MKRFILLLLTLLLAVTLPLYGCDKDEETPPPAAPAEYSPDTPTTGFVSIYRYYTKEDGSDDSGRAYIESTGVIIQLAEEIESLVLTPITDGSVTFDAAHCFEVNFYVYENGSPTGSYYKVSIDKNGTVSCDGKTATIKSGLIDYALVESYYNAFKA